MIKVKIFSNSVMYDELQKEINEWLSRNREIVIKNIIMTQSEEHGRVTRSVLIMYI